MHYVLFQVPPPPSDREKEIENADIADIRSDSGEDNIYLVRRMILIYAILFLFALICLPCMCK